MKHYLKSNTVIQTERLTLRCIRAEDLDDMMELRSDPANSPFEPDDIWRSQQDALDFLQFASLFYGKKRKRPRWFRFFFAITETGSPKVIGFCGLGAPDFDRSITEVFYSLARAKWGRGYATEAAKAMVAFGFNEMKLRRIYGFIHPDNIASRRVLEKSGLVEIGTLDQIAKDHRYHGNPLFEITRSMFTCEGK